jgi:tRNA A37 threonylcarbamoyladenosine dehydratase
MLLGQQAIERLKKAKVAIFGLGGVGSFVAEALCRAGVGSFALFDRDVVAFSNLNRQLVALHSTIGRYKAEVMRERMLDINPAVSVEVYNCFYLPKNADRFPLGGYDYVVDAVDTVTAKLCIIERAKVAGVSVISSMGAGNKLDPRAFKVADIKETSVCPLAKVMRRELKARGIDSLKVVYSTEPPKKPQTRMDARKQPPGSVPFVPSVCGLIIASEVVKDLIR